MINDKAKLIFYIYFTTSKARREEIDACSEGFVRKLGHDLLILIATAEKIFQSCHFRLKTKFIPYFNVSDQSDCSIASA